LPHLLFTLSLITATLYYNLPKSQTNRLQVIQNSLARAVVKAPKFCHVTPILKYLHWLKINERIEYKLLSLTYKALTTAQHTYLHSLISVQPPRATRSSSVVTLSQPPTSLRITIRSFRYASRHLWQLPVSSRQPFTKHPADDVTLSNSPPTTTLTLHHTFTVSFQAFPQIFSTIVC